METKEIKTKNGHIAVVRTYLSGGARRKVNELLYPVLKLNIKDVTASEKIDDSKISIDDIQLDASITSRIQDSLMESSLVSVDGESENRVQKLLDLPEDDYEEVTTELMLLLKKKE